VAVALDEGVSVADELDDAVVVCRSGDVKQTALGKGVGVGSALGATSKSHCICGSHCADQSGGHGAAFSGSGEWWHRS